VRVGARFNNVTTGLKVAALLVFVLAGPLLGHGSVAGLVAVPASASPVSVAAFGLALSPVLFSYLGWNASLYVASEIHDPHRNIPRSLFAGLALCTAIYLAVNAVYLYALPVEAQAGLGNVGEAAARALFGAFGGTLVAAFVLASILGTLNATILVGPRIAYAMAIDGRFFPGVDRVHAIYRTPHIALFAQGATAVALLLVLRRFPSVLDYTTFAIVLATMADTVALYALRARRPDVPRPYRAWGYPWVPALYILANMGIAGAMIRGRPLECAIGLAVLATGLPFYLWFGRGRPKAAA
jgi:APA family basic amino acid/polyamine antiporter